ncbi:MAG: hypothetical protein ACLFWF_13690 [Alphaproteobacteria bacterium]
MDYIPPADSAGPYQDPNPATGDEGSQLPADVFEHPQQEILNAIDAAGLTRDAGDLTQLAQAIVQRIRQTGATTTAKGSVERATQAEVDAGTDDSRYVSPKKLKALLDGRFRGQLIATIKETAVQGFDGGDFLTGEARTRNLNVLDDPYGIVSLNNSGGGPGFILPAGSFWIVGSAPAARVRSHQVSLFDVTGGTVADRGSSEYADDITSAENETIHIQTRSEIVTRVSPGANTTYELQHECERSQSGFGFGQASGFGQETYAILRIYGA